MSDLELKKFYVVRRSFRSVGNFYETGTILTDEDLKEIRYAKIKISEGKIKRWPESDVDQDNMIAYFRDRLGVDDLEERVAARASEGSDGAEPDNQKDDTTPPGTEPDEGKDSDKEPEKETPEVKEPKKEEAPKPAPAAAPKTPPGTVTKPQPTATKQAQPTTTKPKA
jgi:hypothetical protein